MAPVSLPLAANKHYKWAVVGMLWLICLSNYAARQSLSAILPALKLEFGFDAVQLGLIGSAFAWVYAAGSPVAGYIGDRVSRKLLILGGCLFWSATTALTGGCELLWQFVAVRALTGGGEMAYFPSAMAVLSDYHGRRTRSLALSLHQSGVYLGSIIGSWGGAWFAERYGWRSGSYFFGGVGVILAIAFARGLREPIRGAAEEASAPDGVRPPPAGALGIADTFREIFSGPTAPLLMLVFLGANFVATIFLIWTPTFLVEKFHYGLTAAGFAGSVYINLASAASVPVGGWLADRLAARFAGGRVLVQALGLLAGSGFVAAVGWTSSGTVLLVTMTLFGLCKGLYDSNIFAALYDVIEPRARAAAAGLMNTVGWAGGALGPLAFGFATKYGRHGSDSVANMSDAIALGSVIYVLGGLALIAAGRGLAKRCHTAKGLL
jgi:MFS family permease